MNTIKTWIRDHWLTAFYWGIAFLVVVLLLAAASDTDDGVAAAAEGLHDRLDGIEQSLAMLAEPAADEAVEHCGCEGACSKCHHLCLECKCGSHIIDRGIKCQEFAACEAGCSSVADVPPPTSEALYGAGNGLRSDSDVDCQLVRGQADILGSNMAENYSDNDALLRDTKLLQEILTDCGCASAGVGYSGSDVKCPCNVCPWNCL